MIDTSIVNVIKFIVDNFLLSMNHIYLNNMI